MPERENIETKPSMGGLILILILGFLLTISISFFVSRRSLESQIIQRSLPLSGDSICSEIHQNLIEPLLISSHMASNTFVREWLLQGEKDRKKITQYLNEIVKKNNIFSAFLVSDKSLNYYHANGLLKQISPEDPEDDWYFRVKEMKKPFEINVDVDMANDGALTVFINYRILDFTGEYIGATGMGVTANSLKNIIEANEKKFQRQIFFVDDNGNIQLTSDSFPVSTKHLSDIDGFKQYQKLLQKDGATLSNSSFFSKTYITSRYIPEFNWFLIVEEKDQHIVRKLLQTLFINLVICGFVVGIILFKVNFIISKYHRKIEKLAITDKLTGIYNRRAFDMFMNQVMLEQKREKDPLTIILFDIDHFKTVNDNYGHLAGDATMKDIIKIAKASIRESDCICRWGGEEFLILLKNCSQENGILMAENIRRKVERHTIRFNGQDIKVTISLGVIELQDGEHSDALLQRADNALYRAKSSGRNQISSDH